MSAATALLTCQADAACGRPVAKVHTANTFNETDASVMSCGQHEREARKILSRVSTAIIYTFTVEGTP